MPVLLPVLSDVSWLMLAVRVVETGCGAGAGAGRCQLVCAWWRTGCCQLAVRVVETGCWCWCWALPVGCARGDRVPVTGCGSCMLPVGCARGDRVPVLVLGARCCQCAWWRQGAGAGAGCCFFQIGTAMGFLLRSKNELDARAFDTGCWCRVPVLVLGAGSVASP